MASAVTNNTGPLNASSINDMTANQSMANATDALDASVEKMNKDIYTVEEVFDEDKILNSEIYKQQARLLEDPKLEDDEMHQKLVRRLTAFYLNQEKIKINGLTEHQQLMIRKSGYGMEYRVKLHKSLRTKILQIVSEKDVDMKKRQLRETYQWYIDRLVAMGALSKEEQEKEFIFLFPMANSMKNAMRSIIKTKIKSALCDEEQVKELKRAMYDDRGEGFAPPKRSKHTEIAPAEERIRQYKTKSLKNYGDALEGVKNKDNELKRQREQQEFGIGLLTSNLGSVYDIPPEIRDDQSLSTKASTKITSTTQKEFRQTEGASFKPSYQTFFSDNGEVQFTTKNTIAGRSNYFSYYPSNEVHEQNLERIWFYHQNQQL